ncbi:hypothetical protein AC1031_015226 [Aphanomyces cochlioides]|nr:hypothetical protein AC1031_015226 [Aphanomyces cochlioides]
MDAMQRDERIVQLTLRLSRVVCKGERMSLVASSRSSTRSPTTEQITTKLYNENVHKPTGFPPRDVLCPGIVHRPAFSNLIERLNFPGVNEADVQGLHFERLHYSTPAPSSRLR